MELLYFGLFLLGCLQCFVASDFQAEALYEMRVMLNDSHEVLKDWNDNQVTPCYFFNVYCDQDNNVIGITLSSSGLTGVLSHSIEQLTTLQELSLDENGIFGEIPREYGLLTSLEVLKLGRNNFSGLIPYSLGSLPALQILDLSQNLLSGEIPMSFSILTSLKDINLAYNNLSGEIPAQLFQVAKYNFTGNSLNCGLGSTPCEGGTNKTGHMTIGKKKSRHLSKIWIIATVVSLVAAFFCFIFCFGWIRRHRKGKLSLWDRSKANLHGDQELVCGVEGGNPDFTFFDFSQILQATSNFSDEYILGKGGFGPVYKGQFPDGLETAVKRLASHSGQGFAEFKNEIQFIAKLQHRNLVRLLGCCSLGEDRVLVYEYLANKSLDLFIFDQTRRSLLDWNKHLCIIEGIAQGLLYLHKHSRLRIIHRDIKASNILLDSEMNPKISDFGLAKMFTSNDTEGNTRRVVGTYGYMAPEYASEGLFSVKSDVFSFGVLVLEIITGKRNSGFHRHGDFLNLLGYAWQLWNEGRWLELVDASLVPEGSTLVVLRCINIGFLCVQENAADRPTMSDVVAMLTSESMNLPEPKHPAYFHVRMTTEEVSRDAEPCSVNDVTMSTPQGR